MAKGRNDPQESTTPARYPDIPPPQAHPSGDYSYTVELVATINREIGRLTEAVNSLKEQSKDRDHKIDDVLKEVHAVSKDIHAAKVTAGVVGGLFLTLAGFIAWMVNTYISAHPGK